MNCPECQIAYDPHHWDACPHCGCGHDFPGSVEFSGVMRTSTVLIAAGDGEPVFYESVEEVPEPLRRTLVACTNGLNSGTIYIADQGGRALISGALRHLPRTQPDATPTRFSGALTQRPKRRFKLPVSLATLWFTLVIALSLGAVVWMLGSRSW